MTLSGADIDRLRDLAREIDRQTQRLQNLSRSARTQIAASGGFWEGDDARSFRHSWQSRHAPALDRCVAELTALAADVRGHADDQEQTSGTGSTNDGGGGFGFGLSSIGLPGLPGLPDVPDLGLPDLPGFGLPDVPSLPGIPSLPDIPGLPGVPSPGDVWDVADGTADWLGDRAGELWDYGTDQASERWDQFEAWGRDRLGDVADATGDLLISSVLAGDRLAQLLFNSPFLGTPAGGPIGGLLWQHLGAPAAREWWNTEANPFLVQQLFGPLESALGNDDPVPGDSEARIPGQPWPVRGPDDADAPEPFVVPQGDTAADSGRNAVVAALEDTANGEQIFNDEFQIVEHDDNTFTVVLPGVTDLSNPNAGLNPENFSVRDTDFAAAQSAGSHLIDDNRYAQMVEAYIRENVPPGANLAIVGHSFGGDTALDLASDPLFNGRDFTVTHVVAAAYHSEPQLPHVQDGTQVLVLQNSRDIPVVVEEVGHASSNREIFPGDRDGIVVDEFTGGWEGAGHHQNNYIERVQETTNETHEAFFADWAAAGYGTDGETTAVDVSVPKGQRQ
ncbi:MAG: WXG100 family type VII secretion target [Actinomycetota bacterium]